MTACSSSYPAEGDKPKAGAPEDGIEITPEMIEAGVEELSSYNLDFESMEDAVTRIYREMVLAQGGSRNARPRP
jgi:hypothetical protein